MLCFNDELILREECNKWVDDVETTIEKHLNEFKPVVHAKIWKNNKNSKIPKKIVYINVQYRINGVFQVNLCSNHVQFFVYVFQFYSLINPFFFEKMGSLQCCIYLYYFGMYLINIYI